MTTTEDKLKKEYNKTFDKVKDEVPEIEPTDEEKRNGWDAEGLTDYVREQETAAALRVDPHSTARRLARRPTEQNRKYRPLRWRR